MTCTHCGEKCGLVMDWLWGDYYWQCYSCDSTYVYKEGEE